MNKALKLILWIVVLALILGGAGIAYKRLTADYKPEADGISDSQTTDKPDALGEKAPIPAPDFAVYDADGNTVKLSEHTGELPIVLNFWASWCGPCKMEMPDFDAVCAEYEGRVEFMMVNMTDGSQETLESAKAFLEEIGYTFPVYFDSDMSAAAAYSVYSLPTTFFIDADGNVYKYATTMLSGDRLREMIDELIDVA